MKTIVKTYSMHRLFLPIVLVLTVFFSVACTVLPKNHPKDSRESTQNHSLRSEADDQWENAPLDQVEAIDSSNLDTDSNLDAETDHFNSDQSSIDTKQSESIPPSATIQPTATPQNTTAVTPQSTTVGTRKKYKVIIPNENEAVSWYYMKQGKGQVPEFPVTAWFKESYQARWVGSGKKVYLTFDNGGGMGDLDHILSILKKHNVKATFFITGTNMLKNPDALKKVVDDGHLVVNHTMTHRDLTKLDDETVLRELSETDKAYESIIGQAPKKLFRFPFGRFSPHLLELIAAQGYTTHFWSTAMKDWLPRTNGADDAYNDVMNNLHDGNIILLHQGSTENSEALDRIIQGIKDEGYSFGLSDEL